MDSALAIIHGLGNEGLVPKTIRRQHAQGFIQRRGGGGCPPLVSWATVRLARETSPPPPPQLNVITLILVPIYKLSARFKNATILNTSVG